MKTTLRILSLAAIILGTFWGTYALANGFRAIDGDPWYFVPQAVGFYLYGVTGWAVLGALARILALLEGSVLGEPRGAALPLPKQRDTSSI